MIKRFLPILILLFCQMTFAQSKGSISGKITDAKTHEPLFGVNIILKGTYYGASSNIDGKYKIDNISSGSYTIEVSLIGYKTTQYTGYKIEEGKTKQLDIQLNESVLTIGQDVLIVGDKPMVDVEETQSKKSLGRDDIEMAKVENINDLISQQAGIVKTDNEIHIRGGRAYESAYLLDGVSIQDPLAGTGFGLDLSANAIEEVEVITGGFNAEYGQATSGVVNVKTREGGSKYTGAVAYKTDNIASKSSYHVFNTDVAELSFGGPEPITSFLMPALGIPIPGQITFFLSGQGSFSDGITQGYYKPTATQLYSSIFYGTRFAPRAENNLSASAKVTYKISPTFKISYSFNQSVSINQNSQTLQSNLEYVEPSPGYQYTFEKNLDNANTFTHVSKIHSLSLTHTLNSKTFYEVKLSYFYTHMRADANGKSYSQYTEPKDFANFPLEYYNLNRDTVGVIPGDGFWDVGNASTWRDHYTEEIALRADLTSFFDEKNKFKAGMSFNFQEMQVVDISKPWIGVLGANNDIYRVHPAYGAFYAQDNVNFSGMILNFGMRLDYWFPGKFIDDAVDNPAVVTIPDEIRKAYKDDSYSWSGNRHFKARLSPRLGISHPVSDNQILFFSYGHFSKWPNPKFVYAKMSPYNAQSSFQSFGNPNLNPETTVAYELGLKTQFSDDDVLTLTAYYKDIFDYISTRTALIKSARFATQSFTTYVNQDYARSRGLEMEYKKRMGKWFTGSANFTYAIVTGKSSSADEGILVAQGELNESIKENYMPWDRPVTATITTNFYVEKDEPLFGFGRGILDDYNLYLKFFFESGKRYTPAYFTGNYLADGRPEYVSSINDRYSKVGQNWFWIDLNFEKSFEISKIKCALVLEVNNLLNNKNSQIINPATGKAYEYGDPLPSSYNDPKYPDLQAPLSPYPYDPSRYLTVRNVKVGVKVKF